MATTQRDHSALASARTFCALGLAAVCIANAAPAQSFGPLYDEPAPESTSNPEPPVASVSAESATSAVEAAERPIPPQERLPIGEPASRARADANDGQSPGAPSSSAWSVRTLAALTIVIVLIFATRSLFVRLSKRTGFASALGPAGRAPSGVLEVLARYPVGRGQTLVLLRMDRRVLLLSQSSAGFQTLSEVTDPEDIASLLIKTRDDAGESMAKRFTGLLRQFERDPALVGDVEHIDLAGPTTPRFTLFGDRRQDAERAHAVTAVRQRLAALREEVVA